MTIHFSGAAHRCRPRVRIVLGIALVIYLFSAALGASPLDAATAPTAAGYYVSMVSAAATAYSPQGALGMTATQTNLIRSMADEFLSLSLPGFVSGYQSEDLTYKNTREPGWRFFTGRFLGDEAQSPYADSAADYTARQNGGYILAGKHINGNMFAGALYSFRERSVKYNSPSNKEQQWFHNLGGFFGYHQDNWYLIDTATYTMGSHSPTIATSSGNMASADYRSQNIKNNLILGASYDGFLRVMPEIGMSYDYIGADAYADSSGNIYTGFHKILLYTLAGMHVSGNYKIIGIDFEPQAAITVIKNIGNRDIKAWRYDHPSKTWTLVTDYAGKNYLVFDAGLNIDIMPSLAMRLGYIGAIGDSFRSNSASLSIILKSMSASISARYGVGCDQQGLPPIPSSGFSPTVSPFSSSSAPSTMLEFRANF